MALKQYDKHTTKTTKLKGSIPSGVTSGDSDAEMIIAEPLQEHPEIQGLYRAFDPDTNWVGWIEYSPVVIPPTPDPVPTPQEIKEQDYAEALENLRRMKQELDLGVTTQEEYDKYLGEVIQLKSTL